ncbi:hypothetical protein MIND_01093200 [Mycena indigotica]|uniref:HNH nuclease domain-containing protein n=1 Tax=Mycena indigotica TaxID=2126181 RepID=A0A8H6VVL6_9AGAR|nr:uncharacterized protein MIND_01093200 [Mycena indigotica]KAF7295532.1 hypothetical protein MIND_01093200 [Mycena indigotica]
MSHEKETSSSSSSSASSAFSILSGSYLEILTNPQVPTEKLRKNAYKAIRKWLEPSTTVVIGSSTYQIDRLLSSMITFAPTNLGSRYAALIIMQALEQENIADGLSQAAQAWLHHLLLPMQSMRQTDPSPPTANQVDNLQDTASRILPATRAEQSDLHDKVLLREGYQCPIAKIWESGQIRSMAKAFILEPDTCPPPPPYSVLIELQACHIIPLVMNSFTESKRKSTTTSSTSLYDASISWEMLRAY